MTIPDETVFDIVDDHTVRFAFPEPDGMALVRFPLVRSDITGLLYRAVRKFRRTEAGVFSPEPGRMGDRSLSSMVQGSLQPIGKKSSDRVVLEAYEGLLGQTIPESEDT